MSISETYRDKQRTTWRAAADGWSKWTEWNTRCMRPIREWLLDAARISPGMRVLDIASGTGQPAIAEAERVGPGGSVVATDLSPEMLTVAQRRAREAGLSNLEFHTMDAEALDFPDASFDAVTCAYGLMFCLDPARAAAEMRRVLKPGGRVALSVWDEAAANPFFSTAERAVAPILHIPPPDPRAPGRFRLAPAGELDAVLEAGGLRDFTIMPVKSTFRCDSPGQYWEIVNDHAPALRLALEGLPEQERRRAREATMEAAAVFLTERGLRFPALSRCAMATR